MFLVQNQLITLKRSKRRRYKKQQNMLLREEVLEILFDETQSTLPGASPLGISWSVTCVKVSFPSSTWTLLPFLPFFSLDLSLLPLYLPLLPVDLQCLPLDLPFILSLMSECHRHQISEGGVTDVLKRAATFK